MIFSKEELFSDGQAVAAASATVSENTIDLGVPGTVLNGPAALVRDIGPGEPVSIWIGGLLATADDDIIVDLLTDAAADLGTADILASETIAAVVGPFQNRIQFWPEGGIKRYIGLQFTTAATGTLVDVTAGIVCARQTNKTVAAAA